MTAAKESPIYRMKGTTLIICSLDCMMQQSISYSYAVALKIPQQTMKTGLIPILGLTQGEDGSYI